MAAAVSMYQLLLLQSADDSASFLVFYHKICKQNVKRFLPPLALQNAHKMLLPSSVVNTKKFLQQGEFSASSKNYLLWVQTH